jgi:peroxiredoxin
LPGVFAGEVKVSDDHNQPRKYPFMKFRLTFSAWCAIAIIGAFAVYSVHVKNQLLWATSPLESLPIGKSMQDFSLNDLTGQSYTLSKLTAEKKLVMINFWGSWCGPCRLEMPSFEKLYKDRSKDGLVILAIDENDERGNLDAYLKKEPLSFPVLLDPDGALAKQYGIRAYPTTILISTDGKILEAHEGIQTYIEYTIERYLPNKEGPK